MLGMKIIYSQYKIYLRSFIQVNMSKNNKLPWTEDLLTKIIDFFLLFSFFKKSSNINHKNEKLNKKKKRESLNNSTNDNLFLAICEGMN